METAPRSQVSEAVRGVETATSALMMEKGMRSIVVTSLYPSEGRTFITASLASALSSRYGRVLVVDSDLRDSGMGRVFRVRPGSPGLSDILSGRIKDYRSLIHKSRARGLFFLPAGTSPKNPAGLLGSKRMRDLVARLSEDFDLVVFDSPPSQVFSDSAAILRVSHAMALVLEAGKVDAANLRRSIDGIPGANEKLLGVILNKADVRYLKYGRYGYYNYKSYSRVA
jgi:capsular exopolysaccharide synthesis family protein